MIIESGIVRFIMVPDQNRFTLYPNSKEPVQRTLNSYQLPAQVFCLTSLRLLVHALIPGAERRSCLHSLFSYLDCFLNQFFQSIQRGLPIFFLTAVPLCLDDNHAIFADSLVF